MFALAQHSHLMYEKIYKYPLSAEVLGWLMTTSSVICIPFVAACLIFREIGSLKQVLFIYFNFSNEIEFILTKSQASAIDMICKANQWTGFYMIEASVMKDF